MLLNRNRLDSLLSKSDIDLLIITKLENAVYITNFHPMGSRTIKDRLTYVLYFNDPNINPFVIAPANDVRHIRELSWIPENNIFGYAEFKTKNDTGLITSKTDFMANLIEKSGLKKGNIGIEGNFLPINIFKQLKSILPEASFKDCTNLMLNARAIKTDDEVERLKKAEICTEEGCKRMIELAAKGETEINIAQEAKVISLKKGAETIGHIMVGGGYRSAFVHNNPRNEPIRHGEVFRFDFGAIYDGYWGDLARCYIFGKKPTPEQQKIYDSILKTQETALEVIKPGITAHEIYEKAVEAGQTIDPKLRREHIGHGVGLEIHEVPILRAGNNVVIEPGMVICIEAGTYIPEIGGFQIEDTAIVTDNGLEILSSLPKKLWLK